MTTHARGYKVQAAGPEHRAEVMRAVANLWPGIDVTRRHDWLYDENPWGRALTWVTVDDASGEIAGVTSFFPWRMVAAGREVTAALGGDGYVHEKFRRRGIASAMHRVSREAMPEHGIELMFGTPWEGNATPLAQQDARDIVDLVRFARPVGARALGLPAVFDRPARVLLRPRRRGLALDELRGRDPRVDALWERTRPELDIATVRDATFYDWYFRRSPHDVTPFVITERGRPIAACALTRVGTSLRVLDLLAPRDAWGRALAAIVASADGCDIVDLKLARFDAQTRTMLRKGFVARSSNPLNVMLPGASPHASLYFDGARWFFMHV